MVDVAQLGRALRCGRSGCRFKSGRPPTQLLIVCRQARIANRATSNLLLAVSNPCPRSSMDRTRDS